MGIGPVDASTKLPSRKNAKLPSKIDAVLLDGTSAKLPFGSAAKMPNQRSSAAERLRRLGEAQAFLRAHLKAGPQSARTLLKAVRTAGIVTRTLHSVKDAVGDRPERFGGYGAHGLWTRYPPEAGGLATLLLFLCISCQVSAAKLPSSSTFPFTPATSGVKML